jgi:hypothetical protein
MPPVARFPSNLNTYQKYDEKRETYHRKEYLARSSAQIVVSLHIQDQTLCRLLCSSRSRYSRGSLVQQYC